MVQSGERDDRQDAAPHDGEPFDPNVHEAVEVRRGQMDEPAVVEVVQPG